MKPLIIRIPTSLKYLSLARESINAYGGSLLLPNDVIYDIITAVDEALSNVIEHNYKDSPHGIIEVKIKKLKNKLIIEIEDKGSTYSFQPVDSAGIQNKISSRSKRGFGQYLISRLTSKARLINLKGKGNRLIMEKVYE